MDRMNRGDVETFIGVEVVQRIIATVEDLRNSVCIDHLRLETYFHKSQRRG